jgi:hypothetical protein
VNEAVAKLPRLKLASELPLPAQEPAANTAEKTTLRESTACLSLGPFADLDNTARAAAILRARGFSPRQRADKGQPSEGYWVYVNSMKSEAEADQAVATLARVGIKDVLVMPEGSGTGRRLSLGLYSDRARAEKRAQLVRQSGLKPEIAERKLPGTTYWVDLTPPLGMNSVPLQDLFAQGVSVRIAVQPCPAAVHPLPPSGTASTRPVPPAHEASTKSAPPEQAVSPSRLP